MSRLVSALVVLLSLGSLCYATPMVCTFNGKLYDINLATGQTSNMRDSNLPANTHYLDIAYDQGNLYAVTTFDGNALPNSLVKVDPATTARTLVGAIGLSMIEGDLAVDPNTHSLYAVQAVVADSNNGSHYSMIRINTATGAGTVVGALPSTSSHDYSDLTFTSSGDLYAIDNYAGKLLKLNKNDASVISSTSISLSSADMGDLSGMDYDPVSGKIYVVAGLTPKLYTINPADGNMTLVGDTGLGFSFIDGLVGLSTTVPEPATLSLLALGGLALCHRRKR